MLFLYYTDIIYHISFLGPALLQGSLEDLTFEHSPQLSLITARCGTASYRCRACVGMTEMTLASVYIARPSMAEQAAAVCAGQLFERVLHVGMVAKAVILTSEELQARCVR